MGLFKRLGLGLGSDEVYSRAFKKGVLVKNYPAAAKLFGKAADKFQKDNNQEGYNQAMANQCLYSYIAGLKQQTASEQVQLLDQAVSFLEHLDTIEKIGSQTETVPTEMVIDELEGRKQVFLAGETKSSEAKAEHHARAAEFFGRLGENIMFIDGKTARPLYHFHLGSSQFYTALIKAQMDPEKAVELLQETYGNFRLGEATEKAAEVQNLSHKFATTAKCWVCGREIQGQDLHFRYYEARITPYYRAVVESESEEQKVELLDEGLPLCTTCGSMLSELADSYARLRANEVKEELTNWINSLVAELHEVLENHNQRINELVKTANEFSKYSHTH